MNCKCSYCNYSMIRADILAKHEKICTFNPKNKKTCVTCDKLFYSYDELFKHSRTCGKYMCFQCDVPLLSTKALDYHILTRHRNAEVKKKSYKCTICKKICENRKELYSHRLNQHGGNGNNQDIPPFIRDHPNDELMQVYNTNRKYIFAEDETGELKKIYNFTTNDLHGGYREIRGHLSQVYNKQTNAYRINFSFGMILQNSSTGEYRYYIPYYNNKVLYFPFTISNRNSINFLMHKLARIDVIQQARAVRPSTNWILVAITNVQYTIFITDFPLGSAEDLPSYLKTNKHLKTLYINKRTNEPYKDNLCFFRCLKCHFKNVNTVLYYLNRWRAYKSLPIFSNNHINFNGVSLDDICHLEECFNIKIKIFNMNPNGAVNLIYDSDNDNNDVIYLNIFDNHLSYITDLRKFIKKYEYEKCSKMFRNEWNLKRHYGTCYERTKHKFPGGFHKNDQTIFEKLEYLDIFVPLNQRFYHNFSVWDMEAILLKLDQNVTETLHWISRHEPISVSIASNIEGYNNPKCFVDLSSKNLITKMMDYLNEISEVNANNQKYKYKYVFDSLDQLIERYSDTSEIEIEEDRENKERDIHPKIASHFILTINDIRKKFENYLYQLPVVGFNSGKYDINLIKKEIMMFISEAYKDNEIFTIKKNNSYISISTPHLKFLDISNFLAPGCSYSQFLKAYGSELNKGVFPYEWFDSHEKLSFPSLPSPQDFYSKVSNSNPIKSDEDYSKLLQIWEEEGMQNFKDYLIYYNNLDTGPFCIALKNFIDIYSSQEVDIFKDFVTLPGVARKMLFNSSKSKFSLINPADADLYYTLRKNIVGGPSIIFSRYHEKNMTNIKGIDGNKCKAIVGYDCNGLYSYAIKQEMPTGVYVRRRTSTNFKPEVSEKYLDSYVWMDFIMKKEKIKILHKLNNQKEIRIGNYLLDGYCIQNKTVYEYHGCYYHYCNEDCPTVKKIKSHKWIEKIKKVQRKDLRKKIFLINLGYNYVSIQECIFKRDIKDQCNHLYDFYLPSYFKRNRSVLSTEKIVKDIKNGILFGAVEVDINVKSEYIQTFKEFPALFCTCNVPMEAIGEHMLEYCRENDISFDYKRLLISTNQAERILIATPLLRWYLKNNLRLLRYIK